MQTTTVEKVRALPWAIGGNVGDALFHQFTYFGSAFVLFLNELGFSSPRIGFLLSLLSFLGSLAIFASPIIGRLGTKRAFLTFWTGRTLVTGLLVLAPALLARSGATAVFAYVAGGVITFGLLRTVAETALMSWQQEFVPRAMQGKFFATSNTFASLVSIVAVAAASFIIGRSHAYGGFMALFAMGVGFGLVSTWAFAHVPGGAALGTAPARADFRGVRQTLTDRDFVAFMVGVALIILGTGPLAAFLPLFLSGKAGLSASEVVFLQTGNLIPGLLASFLWGWTADRYGGKPIMLWGIYLIAVLPLLWFLMPRFSSYTFGAALAVTLLQGLAYSAWAVGLTRLFFVSVVPLENNSSYMAVYYAMVSITGGLGALAGGWILQWFEWVNGQFAGFVVDGYSVLFLLGGLLPILSLWYLAPVRADSRLTTGQVAGLFLRGNALLALQSPISFRRAKSERATVATTERLGLAQSPLTVTELLQALNDPRYNVRFEALVSIARRGPDEQLLQALTRALLGADPGLSVMAAWAMGRIGDPRAIEPLRQGLRSPYRSVQGYCARALGTLNDHASADLLLQRLQREQDAVLQLAYASALGMLHAEPALDRLVELLAASTDDMHRQELALAIARIMGNEESFIRLARPTEDEPGSSLSAAVTALARRALKRNPPERLPMELLNESALVFAREDVDTGIRLVAQALRVLLETTTEPPPARRVLQACADQLAHCGPSRPEYLWLGIHGLACALQVAGE
jgi:HEAT repeat protein